MLSQAQDPISCLWQRAITDARRKNVRNSAFMEWSFPWYALAVSSNNCLRVPWASHSIQTITFNEGVLSLGCHQVVVIRSWVILCQLELGSIQKVPKQDSEGQPQEQPSCLAPSHGRSICHSCCRLTTTSTASLGFTPLQVLCSAVRGCLGVKRQLKGKQKLIGSLSIFRSPLSNWNYSCWKAVILHILGERSKACAHFATIYWSLIYWASC